MLRNEGEAEEAAQDVFVKVYMNAKKFRKESSFKTWMYKIAYNLCLKRIRRRRLHDIFLSNEKKRTGNREGADGLAKLIAAEDKERMNQVLESLPIKQKTVILLRIREELSFKEIAKIMRTALGTAKANFFFGLKNLQKALDEKNE